MKIRKLKEILSFNVIYNIYSDGYFIDQLHNSEELIRKYGKRKIDKIWGLVIREPSIKPAICIDLKH